MRVELGGQVIANAQEGEISSEMVGLAIAALVLLLTFGTVVAAGLPLATALFGLGISSALIGVLAAVMDVPDWAPALASMLGIGVGIDYALLIVTRYRGALGAGLAPREAVAEAVTTAGRSVLIAGTTVVISLVGPVPHGPPLPLRRRARHDHRGARRDGGVGHARPGAAGDGRHADRPAADPGHEPARGRSRRARRRRAGAARCSAGRWSPRWRACSCCSSSPRRSPGCGSASPTAATTRPTRRRARRTTSSRRASGPGANGPLLLAADAPRTRASATR